MLHTITYSESLSHTIWTILIRVYFRRIHFSLHQTFLFFMDLVIFFGNLDDPRSLSCFTCGSFNHFRQSRRLSVSTSFQLFNYFGMARNSFAQDGGKATTMFIITRKVLLKNFSSGNSYKQNY